ncbi:hypothetical protein B9Q01_01965 [Candidatus Marsarchaeota G1 archaeon OSP_D]|jgi:Phosphomannomutase|uniref:Phosphoglucomutase n=2 Tax=Candidatus Marsarchaeota group 1 TaxID=2203770 RepID=A0A2R6ACZ4_9ARCH|nr:MAG: hypothetical protein B9Q01_01965 [Candidatus Marsarchaeota G1 archaeon OSP_D]PSN89225.1 MAG: hypothetical protein B9Q00_02430 [Candidatus Marsarchaeota G1 archaeon OSP_C]
MFTSQIRFGTDGWRSRMDADFNRTNVRRLAYAVGKYLSKKQGKSVIVGYDTRRNSSVFALDVASVLGAMGYKVQLTSRPTPTPVVAYTVVRTQALAAVQITASHNPPIYNGFKFIPDYGGPAFPEITSEIESYLPEGDVYTQQLEAQRFDPMADYFEFVSKNVDLTRLQGLKIVTDPLYGAGFGYLSTLLSRFGAKVEEIHGYPDPEFGGLSPEPNRENTRELAKKVVESKADFGIANDGDADRFAAVDEKGEHYSSNMLVLVIADYLFRLKGLRGKVARSVSTTSKLDKLCARYGIPVVETPVGFKYLAKELMSGAVLAAEESGGIGYGWSVPEKDGLMSGALLCEAISKQGRSLKEVWERVQDELGEYHYLQYNFPAKDELKARIERLRAQEIERLNGIPVKTKITIDGLKLVLQDGSWVLLRPSGTEPLIRVYIEATEQRLLEELKKAADKLILG